MASSARSTRVHHHHRRRKRRRTSRNLSSSSSSSSPIKSLPGHLLTEVIARVASSSLADLFNIKSSCREFHGATDDDYVFQHASMEKFPVAPWDICENASSFLRRCQLTQNAEALYRQGMYLFFTSKEVEAGMECLKKAGEKGHTEALYVYGVILVCQSNRLGLELLCGTKSFKQPRSKLARQCRARIQNVVYSLWINNNLEPPQLPCLLRHHQLPCPERTGRSWNYPIAAWRDWFGNDTDDDDDDDTKWCEACRWNCEVVSFCNMLRGKDD